MTSTFFKQGRGHSINALDAHDEGRFPLSRAVPVVAKAAGVTKARAKEALVASHGGEWHHVGKFATRVNYYDTAEAVAWLARQALLPPLEAVDFRARISAALAPLFNADLDERAAACAAICTTIAAETGIDAEEIANVYYGVTAVTPASFDPLRWLQEHTGVAGELTSAPNAPNPANPLSAASVELGELGGLGWVFAQAATSHTGTERSVGTGAVTPAQLRTAGMSLYGMEWQTPLARMLGISPRAIRHWLSGSRPIPDDLADRILALMGVGDHLDLDRIWPRDEWVHGEGSEGDEGERREYLIHTRKPRFMARVAAEEDGLDLDADRGTGITYGSAGYVLCEIVWIDPPPGPDGLLKLMEAACDAVDGAG